VWDCNDVWAKQAEAEAAVEERERGQLQQQAAAEV